MRKILFYILPIVFIILSIGFCGDYVLRMARLKNTQVGTSQELTRDDVIANQNDCYTITYDLDGGIMPNYQINGSSAGKENPTTYTLFTESFTLVNPEKDGYDFIGWTGTDLIEPRLTVTICKGSSGDLEFKANYRLNSLNSPTIALNGSVVSWQSINDADKYYIGLMRDIDEIITSECSIDLLDYVDLLGVPVTSICVRAYNSTYDILSESSNLVTFRYEPVDDSFNYTCPVTIHIDYTNSLDLNNKPEVGTIVSNITLSFALNGITYSFDILGKYNESIHYSRDKENVKKFCNTLSTTDYTFLSDDEYWDIYTGLVEYLIDFLYANGEPIIGNMFSLDIASYKPAIRKGDEIILAKTLIFNLVFDSFSKLTNAVIF